MRGSLRQLPVQHSGTGGALVGPKEPQRTNKNRQRPLCVPLGRHRTKPAHAAHCTYDSRFTHFAGRPRAPGGGGGVRRVSALVWAPPAGAACIARPPGAPGTEQCARPRHAIPPFPQHNVSDAGRGQTNAGIAPAVAAIHGSIYYTTYARQFCHRRALRASHRHSRCMQEGCWGTF